MIWYWDGAASIQQLATEGTKETEKCKFTVVVDELEVLEVIQIIPCTAQAEKSIKEVKEWRY